MAHTTPAAPPVLGLHHSAYRCRDAEETRHFYEDLLGLPLIHVVKAEHVSTGQSAPFAHLFFKMTDGSCIERLEANGIEVLGVTDHEFVNSIYFFDPNGVRLEFTTQVVGEDVIDKYASEAHDALKAWTESKKMSPLAKAHA